MNTKKSLALFLFLVVIGLGSLATFGSPLVPETRAQTPAGARVNLHIEGMHCASCPLTVRTVLGRLSGVTSVTVSLADKRALVVYDPRRVTPERLAQAVTDAGYPTSIIRRDAFE